MKNLIRLTVVAFLMFSFVSCEKSSQAKGEAKGTDLLAYSPQNSNVLFYANISNLKSAEILQGDINKYDSEARKHFDEKFKEFIKLTGFDPSKDVNEVMVSGNYADDAESVLFSAKGNFPSEKLIAYVEKEKDKIKTKKDVDVTITKSEYNGHTIYQFSGVKTNRKTINGEEVSSDKKSFFVTFKNENLMLAGEENIVKTALDGKSSVKENSAFMAKLHAVSHNDMYSVLDVEPLKDKVTIPKEFKHKAEMIKNVSFGMSANTKLSFSLVSECLNAVEAQNLRDVVQGLVAMARIGVSGERDLIDFMNEVEVKTDETKLTVGMQISQERLDKLKKYKEKLPLKEI